MPSKSRYGAEGTKPRTGGRYLGKHIGKMPRGITLSPSMDEPVAQHFRTERQKRQQMWLNAYQRAMRTTDKRRIRGLRAGGIIVHAEKIDPGWHNKINLLDRTIKDAKQLISSANASFVNSEVNTIHTLFVKNNVVTDQKAYPIPYPDDAKHIPQLAELENAVLKDTNAVKTQLGADGYFIIQNKPTAKIDDQDIKIHSDVSNAAEGYKGGVIVKPGFTYGLIEPTRHGLNLQQVQIPVPEAKQETVPGFDGPYAVLNAHQDLINKPATGRDNAEASKNISQIASTIERSKDTTLLIYTDQNGKTTGVQEIPNPLLRKAKKFDDFIESQMAKYGATDIVAVVNHSKMYIAKAAIRRTLKKAGINIKVADLDVKSNTAELLDPAIFIS